MAVIVDAVAMCTTVFGTGHMRTATSRVRLAEVFLHTDRATQGEPLLRPAITTFEGISERHWRAGDARAPGRGIACDGSGRRRDLGTHDRLGDSHGDDGAEYSASPGDCVDDCGLLRAQ